MRSTAACRSATATGPSGTIRARPVAKFTSARVTPGCRPSTRWTRTAQDPQVMPCTSKSTGSVRPGGAWLRAVSVISRHPHVWAVLLGGNLVALLGDRLDQTSAVDGGLVVGHRHRPGGDVDGCPLDPLDRPQCPLDRGLAVVTVNLWNKNRLGDHAGCSLARHRGLARWPCHDRTSRATAAEASATLASASGPPVAIASRTQWARWSSSSSRATDCNALVAAEIWVRTSMQ